MKRTSLEQRALEAVRRLAAARANVFRLTKAIGRALAQCEKCPMVPMGEDEDQERDEKGRSKTCLWASMQPIETDFGRDYPDRDESRDSLEAWGCDHCKGAGKMIDERKAAKKRRAAALSWIAKLGKAAQGSAA